uniref:Uncharacterized protein n=1 Tax=Echinococcus canadensis TaxID=519352 RepID=A0A915EXZ5_9CEST
MLFERPNSERVILCSLADATNAHKAERNADVLIKPLFVKVFSLITPTSVASCKLPNDGSKKDAPSCQQHATNGAFYLETFVIRNTPKYSKDSERLADYSVSRCRFEHLGWRVYPQYNGLGQNIAAVGGLKPTFTKVLHLRSLHTGSQGQ